MNFESSRSSFLARESDCPQEQIKVVFGKLIPFLASSIYRPWENEGQECPKVAILAYNQKAKELFQQEANSSAIDIVTVIRNLQTLAEGTKLRMISKGIDAVLQIKGRGQHKKIRLMFTNSGTWRVSCFAQIDIRLLAGNVYPCWLSYEQKALYKKLKWLYSHHKSAGNL